MVERGTFQTDHFFEYTAGNDFAYRQGHFFADRPPGTALLAVPFYLFGKLFDSSEMIWPQQEVIRHMVTVLPALAGAWCIIILVRLLFRLTNGDPQVPTLVGIYAALGSQIWKFSSHLFSHILLSALLLFLFARLVELHKQADAPTRGQTALSFLLIGLLPSFGYEGGLLIPVFVIGFVLRIREMVGERWRHEAVRALLALAIPLLLLGTYHQLVWGAPWRTFSSFQNPLHFGNLHFSTLLTVPLARGLWSRFFYIPSHVQDCPIGLFVLHPLLCVGLLGYFSLWRFSKRVAVVHLVSMLIYACFFGKYWDICGGSSGDPRYLLPMVPMLCVTLGMWLAGPFASWRVGRTKAVMIACLGFAASLGALMCLIHFSQFHGHDFDYRRDINHYSLIGYDTLSAVLSRIFIGIGTLRYMALALAALSVVYGVGALMRRPAARLADHCGIRCGFLVTAAVSLLGVYLQHREQLRIAELPHGELCMHRYPQNSLLPIMVQYEVGREKTPKQHLPLPLQFEATTASTSNYSEYFVFNASVDVLGQVDSTLDIEVDDELFIFLNGVQVVDIPGVRGRTPFHLTLPLRAGRNELRIGHANLGGLGWFSMQNTMPDGTPVAWECDGTPGFCLSHRISANVLRSPRMLERLLQSSPRQLLAVPFDFSLSDAEPDAMMLWGYFDNPYLTPQDALLNLLVDDEMAVVLNGRLIGFEYAGAQAPRGMKVKLSFPPGRSELLIFYRNAYVAGYFRGGIWSAVDDSPLPLRCAMDSPNPTASSLPESRLNSSDGAPE